MGINSNFSMELFGGIGTLLAVGLLLLFFGRRFSRQGGWFVGTALLLLVMSVISVWNKLFEKNEKAEILFRGWVGPWFESRAVHVGFLNDFLGMSIILLMSTISLILLSNPTLFKDDGRLEKVYAGMAFSFAGIATAWTSLTPWMAVVGIGFSLFGGLLALSGRWDQSDREGLFVYRYSWDHAWGFLFLVVGAAVISSLGVNLRFDVSSDWIAEPRLRTGATVLVLGVYFLLRPFPFTGWTRLESRSSFTNRVLITQLFFGMAVLALIFRLEPHLRQVGVFPGFGWIAFLGTGLTAIPGLFQSDWKKGISFWVSAALSSVMTALAFSGQQTALALLIGFAVGVSALVLASAIFDCEGKEAKANSKKLIWGNIAVFTSAAACSGFVGFVSFSGQIHWLKKVQDDPLRSMGISLLLFLLALLAWKTAWAVVREKKILNAPWGLVLSPFFVGLLSLAAMWTGTATGGAVLSEGDRWFKSLIDFLLFVPTERWEDESTFFGAMGFYSGATTLAISIAYWMRGSWDRFFSSMGPFSKFLANSYEIDRISFEGFRKISSAVGYFEKSLSALAWNRWLVSGCDWFLRAASQYLDRMGVQISKTIDASFRIGSRVPSKALQMIQNGNLQWYLFFAVGMGVAILIHFLMPLVGG